MEFGKNDWIWQKFRNLTKLRNLKKIQKFEKYWGLWSKNELEKKLGIWEEFGKTVSDGGQTFLSLAGPPAVAH